MCYTTSYFGVRLSLEQVYTHLFPDIPKWINKYSCTHYQNNPDTYKNYKYCPQCSSVLQITEVQNIPELYSGYEIIETADYRDQYMVCMYKHNENDDKCSTLSITELDMFIGVLKASGAPIALSIYTNCMCSNCR